MENYKDIIADSQNGNKHTVKEIWKQTLKVENIGLAKCKAWIKDNLVGKLKEAPNSYHPQWDICKGDTCFEVKTMPNASKYKSVFVEYLEKGKLSGLSLTESDYYWFSTDVGEYKIPTTFLKEYGHLKGTKHTKGGINATARGFILKLNHIKEYLI